jgi:hypothetical protein
MAGKVVIAAPMVQAPGRPLNEPGWAASRKAGAVSITVT